MPDWRWFRKLTLRLRTLFQRDRVEREIEEEFQFHIEQRVELEIARGLSPEEARLIALRAMDGVEQRKEECRDMRRVNYIDDLLRDLRYAGRNLRRSPGFATLAVLIMALGIGANTAVFSVVNAVLLKPLSFHDPDRIVVLSTSLKKGDAPTALSKQVSIPDFQDWHDQSSSFEALAYYSSREEAMIANGAAEFARRTPVSPEFFRVFGVEPIVGRPFTAEEMKRGSGGAAMISYALWQSRFGGDPRILGQTIRAPGPRPIAGVLPPGFRFPDNTDVWVSAVGPPGGRGGQNWLAIGRLKTSVTLEQAQAEMTTIAGRLEQQYPASNSGRGLTVTKMRDEMVGNVRLMLYLLLGAVSVVLLIACANTATLLLGKATARTREVAVRTALGASRPRIIRQLVTESLLLAFVAGAAGLLLAYWGSRVLVAVAPANVPRLAEVGIDRGVLIFALGVSVITSVMFGLVPALYASRVNLSDTLKQGAARLTSGRGTTSIRGVLVVGEIALAVVLLCGAGLLIKSFVALQNVALGFRPENVLAMRATVTAPHPFGTGPTRQFFKNMLSRVSSIPGVLAAGATMAPPGNVDFSTGGYIVGPLPANPDWTLAPNAVQSIVAPGTFAALGIPLKRGRDFSDNDVMDRPLVAVVNEALVRKSFGNQDPIGQTIHCPFDSLNALTIIGVAGDVRQRGPEREPMPECYMPYGQHAFGPTLSMVVRTAGSPTALEQTLRRLAHDTSPEAPIKFTTMEALLSENVAAPRFRALLFAVFAVLAVCLAMAGVYGVMAFAVGQQSSEIGVRMALGATTGLILRLILRQGLVLAGLGLALGLAASVAGSQVLSTVLFNVKPNDPEVYLAVIVLLGVTAVLASYIPARRASKIDPLAAIRQE